MKKYMLVIYSIYSDEVYLYNSIYDMLNDWEVDSLDELGREASCSQKYVVYEISDILLY